VNYSSQRLRIERIENTEVERKDSRAEKRGTYIALDNCNIGSDKVKSKMCFDSFLSSKTQKMKNGFDERFDRFAV
jgi:hypothetical protein